MSTLNILHDICKKIEVSYFNNNSEQSLKIRTLLEIDFKKVKVYNTSEILNIKELSCSLLIFDISENNYSNKIKKKLEDLSKKFVILLSLTSNSDLRLYDKLKQDYEINSFDKSNINAVINVIATAVKYIQKQSKINSLENKVSEFKKILEIYDEHIIASITDKKGIIKYATKAFSIISGFSNNELLGNKHSLIRHKDQDNNTFKNLWKSISCGKIWKGEIKNKKKDGGFYWVYATISPEFDEFNNIVGYSAIRQDITEKKHIEYLAITDSLTKLYNRRHFDTVFKRELKNAKRHQFNLAFILLDIDFFKQYNDAYGHQEGDNVLKKVAKCLQNTFRRPDDYAFRVGGEEFAILFIVEEKNDSILLAQELLKNIENLKIEHKDSKILDVLTISIGLSYVQSSIHLDTKYLYKVTDDALYFAKRKGRNQLKSVNIKTNSF